MRMAELADAVRLSRSGLTRLVDRLVGAGLLERRQCPTDARATHLAGVRERFLRHLSPEELDQLASVWERVEPGAAET